MKTYITIISAIVAAILIIGIGFLAAMTDNWFVGFLCGLSIPEAIRWLKGGAPDE